MKRYFMVRDEHMPTVDQDYGSFHFVDLSSHGSAGHKWNLLCLNDGHVMPHSDWIAFPPIYDATTTLEASAVPHDCLADVGLNGSETAMQAVAQLAQINPALGL
jgi:hypothetical protein